MNLKMKGLKKVCGETKQLNGRYYLQINYSPADNIVWTDDHVGCIGNSYSTYCDKSVVSFFTETPMTMQEIKERIESRLFKQQRRKDWERQLNV